MLLFGCVAFSDLYLFQETILLNPSFIFSKNLMLLFIDKVIVLLLCCSSSLCCWNTVSRWISGWSSWCFRSSWYFRNYKIFQDYKSSSIPQLIWGTSIDLQKLQKYFSGTTTSVLHILLLISVLFIICLLLKKNYFLLPCCCLSYNYQQFHSGIELSNSVLQVVNRFLHVLNQRQPCLH